MYVDILGLENVRRENELKFDISNGKQNLGGVM